MHACIHSSRHDSRQLLSGLTPCRGPVRLSCCVACGRPTLFITDITLCIFAMQMPTRGLIVNDGTGSDYGDWSSSSSDAEDASAACEQPQAQPAQQQAAGEQAGNADLGNGCEAAAVTPPALQPLVPEPASQGHRSAPAYNSNHADSCSDSSSDSSSDSNSTGASDACPRDLRPWPIRFPVLYEEMSAVIQRLGGSVVPKLNWSCPVDALWINPSTTLACSNPEQVSFLCVG